jgi:hypothetical protein
MCLTKIIPFNLKKYLRVNKKSRGCVCEISNNKGVYMRMYADFLLFNNYPSFLPRSIVPSVIVHASNLISAPFIHLQALQSHARGRSRFGGLNCKGLHLRLHWRCVTLWCSINRNRMGQTVRERDD